jgi:uncharacterized membrane protein HdeD (DUF308 family)
MTSSTPTSAEAKGKTVLEAMHQHWVAFLIEGILLVVLGLLAVTLPELASLAATVLFGWILLLSGVMGLVTTIRARRAPGFIWSLISALLGIAAGMLLLWSPLRGTLSLTAILIAFLIVEGIVSILYALEHRSALTGRAGWMIASGIVDLILGIMLFAGLPGTAVWAIGLLVGINLLFGGWALIWMALHSRSVAAAAG